MSGSVKFNKDNFSIGKAKRKGIAFWQRLRPLLEELYKGQGKRLSYDNLDAEETSDGIHLKGNPGSETNPWRVTANGDGTFNCSGPTYNGHAIADATLTIDTSGTHYVVVEVVHNAHVDSLWVLESATLGDFVSATFTSSDTDIVDDVIVTDGSPVTFHFPIAKIVDGVPKLLATTAATSDIRDNSDGSDAHAALTVTC